MISWEWENLEYFFNPMSLAVSDAGPLLSPIQNFSVRRDEDGQLILETVSSGDERERQPEVASGTVRTVTEAVIFKNCRQLRSPYHAVAKGVIPREYTTSRASGGRETTETSLMQSIEGVYRSGAKVAYTIEWIENIDQSGSIWTGASISTTELVSKTRTLKSGDNKIDLVFSDKNRSISNSGIRLKIDVTELYVCAVDLSNKNVCKVNTGFILYIGDVPESRRHKIRDVISFCIGKYLSYIGYVALDESYKPVLVKASSARRLGSSTSKIPALPPAPLGGKYQNMIHQDVVGKMANAIFTKYDELSFSELSWAYWHAVCAPAHMAAAHYGAALEALRRSCTESRGLKTTLASSNEWKRLKEELSSCLSSAGFDEATAKVFENKLSGLNQLPPDMAMEKLLKSMGLRTGSLERQAWKRRNQAAHGSSLREAEFTAMIRETRLLRNLLHRMVLAATGASDRYVDYYSLGFPLRPLSDPVSET